MEFVMSVEGPRLSYLLRQTQLANHQHLDRVLQEFGLTPSQYTVLGIVSDHPEGIFSAALARRLGVAPQSSNEIVAGLERADLIRRVEDAGPRRVLSARLTAKGRGLLAKCEKAVDRFEADFFGALSAVEQLQLRELLAQLMHASRKRTASETSRDSSGSARPEVAAR